MNRLLFAAARGARVEKYDRYYGWGTFPGVLVDTPELFRIHPADAHLQYGPLSTAVRNSALKTDCVNESHINSAIKLLESLETKDDIVLSLVQSDETNMMSLLFLAEYLADDGL